MRTVRTVTGTHLHSRRLIFASGNGSKGARLRIALDAMGGDFAPTNEVEGAIQAVRQLGIGVVLVGRRELILAELENQEWEGGPDIEIAHASEAITMDDPVAKAVRRKRDSSIHVAARLVREGYAGGLVSAGNTGAVMMTAKLVLGTLPNLDRPALATVLPTLNGKGTVLLDVGANSDCKPAQIEHFAIMGSQYAQTILARPRPSVGLLSIGEEEIKGNELTKETYKLLEKNPGIHFVGNVEGRDVYTGEIDVIVCDGFTGNVVLKVSEGLTEMFQNLLREEMLKKLQTQLGAVLVRPAFQAFKKRLDYAEFGGAPLLGAKQVTVICHGRSNPRAIRNALRVAKEFCEGGVNERIEQSLAQTISASASPR